MWSPHMGSVSMVITRVIRGFCEGGSVVGERHLEQLPPRAMVASRHCCPIDGTIRIGRKSRDVNNDLDIKGVGHEHLQL